MSETKRPLTGQEMDQASRVEAWRLYQEQLAAEAAAKAAVPASDAAPRDASMTFERGENEPPLADHVKVRGTKDNEALERRLSSWEKDVRQDAARHRGVVPPKISGRSEDVVVRLKDESGPLLPPADTETELNGLIAECRYLMREVAFTSACLTYDPDDRLRFLGAAERMALTASKIGKTVAQLRGASGTGRVETHRHEMVYTHTHSTPSLPPSDADS